RIICVNKLSISLTNTVMYPRTDPIANKNNNVMIIINGKYTICQVGITPKIAKKIDITTKPNKKLTNCDKANDTGKIICGKSTIFIIEIDRKTELAEALIDELIHRQTINPITKKTG